MNRLREWLFRKGLVYALWVIDSETSEEVLIDLATNEVLAKRRDGKIVDPTDVAER